MSEPRKAVLIGAGEGRHLGELSRLAETLGLEVVGRLEQVRRDGSGYIGKGKREELSGLVKDVGAELVVADDELSASQARTIEKSVGISVVDRTELIIRIFESHARDAASRLEVELADLEYRLPRIKGSSNAFSRLGGGGFTTRGSGEQQLEYDRRVIRERISTINSRLKDEAASREVRGRRRKNGSRTPSVALVGYTNAGKTTILNALTGAERSTRDRLFETLETTTRVVESSSSNDDSESRPGFIVTDTVGFIQKLPTQLVHSFASTLEAARDADVIVLCADASSDDLDAQISTVRETLDSSFEFESDHSLLLCLNKIDAVGTEDLEAFRQKYPEAVFISALRSVDTLLDGIHHQISRHRPSLTILIPHDQYGSVSKLYSSAEIHNSTNTEEGLLLEVTLPASLADRYEKYAVANLHDR